MSMLEYLVNSILGLAVVFFALVLLMIIIKIITAVISTEEITNTDTVSEIKEIVQVPAPGSAGNLSIYDTDPRTAAMIMAIVADELHTPLNELRFISIKEVKQ